GTDVFTYTLTDGDGDTSQAALTLECVEPLLIVGKNVGDDAGSTTRYLVGDGFGVITGGVAADILIGDAGGSFLEPQLKDYNVTLILDVSGSMETASRLTLLQQAVNNLLADFHDYDAGSIKVHIIPFSTSALGGGTFDVTTAGGY